MTEIQTEKPALLQVATAPAAKIKQAVTPSALFGLLAIGGAALAGLLLAPSATPETIQNLNLQCGNRTYKQVGLEHGVFEGVHEESRYRGNLSTWNLGHRATHEVTYLGEGKFRVVFKVRTGVVTSYLQLDDKWRVKHSDSEEGLETQDFNLGSAKYQGLKDWWDPKLKHTTMLGMLGAGAERDFGTWVAAWDVSDIWSAILEQKKNV